MFTKEQRYQKLDNEVSEVIAELYSSDVLTQHIDTITQTYTIENIPALVHTLGDTILGFYQTKELPELLQKEIGLSADDALKVVSDLTELFTPVLAREEAEMTQKQTDLKELEETLTPTEPIIAQTQPIKDTPSNKLPTKAEVVAPAPHTPVQGMRTMEGDMGRVHGYGAYRAEFPDEKKGAEHKEEVIRSASQDDLLTEKPPLADMPTYDEDTKVN